MPNISIPKGASVYLPFVVFGTGGPNATPPDIDVTTVVPPSAVVVLGNTEIAAQLVVTDGSATRRLRVDGLLTGQVGVARGNIAVTARGKTANQLVDLSAPPDFSAVQFGAPSASFQTPAPGDPVQFP